MDFDKLRTFQQVAINGSISKAIKVLGMNKSSISRHLSSLEKQLDKPLFERKGQKLILTHDEEYLLKKANHILMEIEATKSYLSSNIDKERRTFTVSTTYAVASLWLTRFLHDFIDQNPHIQFNIRASAQPLNLSLREADVAIRPFCTNQSDYIQKHLLTWRLHLYASKSYIKKFGMPKKIEELDHHRLIILGDNPNVYPYQYASWPLINKTKKGRYRTPFLLINSVEGMYNFVANGVGIGNFGNNFPYLDTLIPIFPLEMWHDIDAYLIYPKELKDVETIKNFENFLFTYIKEHEK